MTSQDGLNLKMLEICCSLQFLRVFLECVRINLQVFQPEPAEW